MKIFWTKFFQIAFLFTLLLATGVAAGDRLPPAPVFKLKPAAASLPESGMLAEARMTSRRLPGRLARDADGKLFLKPAPLKIEALPAPMAIAPKAVRRIVTRLAPEYGLDPALVTSVIAAESAFKCTAVSPKGAQGLMQLIPQTAARFGVKDPFDPVENVRGGMAYLRWLLAFFRGDVALTLAAYNAGERAVERNKGIPPYAETRAYVKKIRKAYPLPTHPFDPKVADPSPVFAAQIQTASAGS